MNLSRITLVFLLGCLLFTVGCGDQNQGKEPIAFVDKIEKGEAQVKHAADKDFGAIQVKMPLFEGDIVKTAEKAEVVLMFSTGAIARILPNTQFEIKAPKLVQTSMKVIYTRLIDGVATFYVPKGNEGAKKFEVETDRAVASIKGTAFKLSHHDTNTILTVLEGEVGFKPKGKLKKTEGANTPATPGTANVETNKSLADSKDTDGEILVGAFQRATISAEAITAEKVNALEDPDLSEVDKIIKLSH